jgi:hypothetical protein
MGEGFLVDAVVVVESHEEMELAACKVIIGEMGVEVEVAKVCDAGCESSYRFLL